MNPDYWVHSLTHQFNGPCYDLGPALAVILLGAGGILDQAGVSNNFANCPLTTPSCSLWTQLVTLPGTSWKGYIRVDDSVLRGAKCLDMGFATADCLRAMELPIPNSGNTAHFFWYGPDSAGYYMQMWWVVDGSPWSGSCFANPGPQSLYWVDLKSSTGGQCNQQRWGAITNPCCELSYGLGVDNDGGLQIVWSQYRGAGARNPSAIANMTSTDWRTWAQTKDWATLQSELQAIISGAHSWHTLAQIEIFPATDAPFSGPNFECSNKPPVTPESSWSTDFSEACRVYYPSQNP
jgi:hypothetical protein